MSIIYFIINVFLFHYEFNEINSIHPSNYDQMPKKQHADAIVTKYEIEKYGKIFYSARKIPKKEAMKLEKNSQGAIKIMWLPRYDPTLPYFFCVPVKWQWIDNATYLPSLSDILLSQYDFLSIEMQEEEVKNSYESQAHYKMIMEYMSKWKNNQVASKHKSSTQCNNKSSCPTTLNPTQHSQINDNIDNATKVLLQKEFARKEFMQMLYCLLKKARSNMNMPKYNRTNQSLSHNERLSYQTKQFYGNETLENLATQTRTQGDYTYYDDLCYEKLKNIVGVDELTKEADGNSFTLCKINMKWNKATINLSMNYWLSFVDGNGHMHTKAH